MEQALTIQCGHNPAHGLPFSLLRGLLSLWINAVTRPFATLQ